MPDNPRDIPTETEGREEYYDVALINIVLFCDQCGDCLDPDEDLGPGISFESEGWYILLGDEAFRRGWLVAQKSGLLDLKILCPACRKLAS